MNTQTQRDVTYYNLCPATGEPVEVPQARFKGIIPVKTSRSPGRIVETKFFGWDQPEFFTYVHRLGGSDPFAIVAKFHADNTPDALRQHALACI